MENRINRLIWEAKKKGKPVNPWAICTSSVGGKIGDTKRSDWTKDQKERYEKCVKDVKKKSPIKEHHGEDWDPKILDMSVNTFLDKVKTLDKNDYDSIEKLITKHSSKIVSENRINEYGGYDDPSMYAKHAGGYMGSIKGHYNGIVTSLNELHKLLPEVLDDKLRKSLESFLNSVDKPINDLAKAAIQAEKTHLKDLRGGRPTPRDLDNE